MGAHHNTATFADCCLCDERGPADGRCREHQACEADQRRGAAAQGVGPERQRHEGGLCQGLGLVGRQPALGADEKSRAVPDDELVVALAAALLFPAAQRIVAVDNDPEATETTRENAEHNQLGERLEIFTGTALELGDDFDLILANIRPSVLIPIADQLARRLAPGGLVMLSGILGEEAEDVLAAYTALGLRLHLRRDLNEWCALILSPGDPA